MSRRVRRLHWVAPLIADLQAAHGRALVHVGPDQPAELHALVHAMNEALGARGTTFDLIEPVAHQPVDQTRIPPRADRGNAGRAGDQPADDR